MTNIRPFKIDDLFRINSANLDSFTETYGLNFYLQYLARWPEFFQVAEAPDGEIMGYSKFVSDGFNLRIYFNLSSIVMGKIEGKGKKWHGHVTALTVGAQYRRLNLAANLMHGLELTSEK